MHIYNNEVLDKEEEELFERYFKHDRAEDSIIGVGPYAISNQVRIPRDCR